MTITNITPASWKSSTGTTAWGSERVRELDAALADVKRYQWLRDNSFIALAKKPNVTFTHQIDKAKAKAIDSAMEKS